MCSVANTAGRLALAVLPILGVRAFHQGALEIELDGSMVNLHVAALSEWNRQLFATNGAKLHMQWGEDIRGFVAKEEMEDMPQSNYFNFTLFNKELSYEVDLNKVGCSCNAALFFVSMPGFNEDGTVAHGSLNPWYCDANQVGGVWCWEHDTIEGNKYTMATTPHVCNANPGHYISECDGVGCRSNAFYADPKAYCPDASCKIDTRKPFRIVQRFHADAHLTKLVRISNRLVQGNRTFDWDSCGKADYLERMTTFFKGNMTMVFQLWGTDYKTMNWLDDMTACTGDCIAEETEVTFSHIAIRSLATEKEIVV